MRAMRGLRWTGGRRPERSLREHLRPRSMAAMRRRFPIADCDHGEARWSRKMDECEGRISARELVARRCWASVRSSAIQATGGSSVGWPVRCRLLTLAGFHVDLVALLCSAREHPSGKPDPTLVNLRPHLAYATLGQRKSSGVTEMH